MVPAMFTGIITDIGKVARIERPGDTRLVIETAYDVDTIAMGASISCSGACLTVVAKEAGWFAVDASDETLSTTSLGEWETGRRINLERALRLGDELGGHMVSGHVDGVARVIVIKSENDSHRVTVEAPADLARFIAPKGSITLDGISLTVNEVEGRQFGVNIIPHTWRETTLSNRTVGDAMNMEVDMLARYVARLLNKD